MYEDSRLTEEIEKERHAISVHMARARGGSALEATHKGDFSTSRVARATAQGQ